MQTYAEYLTQAEADIASGKRKQTPMIEYIWNEIRDKDSLAPNPAGIEFILASARDWAHSNHPAEVKQLIGGNLGVPCSRYGRTASSVAPVAVAAAYAFAEASAVESSWDEHLDYMMGLAVNDHDDILYLLSEFAPI
jgi:hypothetical protein